MATYLSTDERKQLNANMIKACVDGDERDREKCAASLTDVCRTHVYEEPFNRKILTMVDVKPEDLVRQETSEDLVALLPRERKTPVCYRMAYNDPAQDGIQIGGDRTKMVFHRIASQKYYKDVALLEGYEHDLREMIADNTVPMMGEVEDAGLIAAANRCVSTTPGTIMATTGIAQYVEYGAMTRQSLHLMNNIMPSTENRIESQKMLANVMTMRYVAGLDGIEWGNDQAGDFMTNGIALTRFLGKDLVLTIKHNLVPVGTFWHWGPDGMLGRMAERTPPTMYVDKRFWFIEFMFEERIGGVIENSASVVRVDYIL